MTYTHLTKEERYEIRAMLQAGCAVCETAKVINRSPSKVSRELGRNRGQRGYRPGQADRLGCDRARVARTRTRLTERDWAKISELARKDWSPEQISVRLRREGRFSVSPEWIFQFIYANKATGGDLWSHLRCQRKRRKRYGSGYERRGRIPERVGIEKRPAGAYSRRRSSGNRDYFAWASCSGSLPSRPSRPSSAACVRWPSVFRRSRSTTARNFRITVPLRTRCGPPPFLPTPTLPGSAGPTKRPMD